LKENKRVVEMEYKSSYDEQKISITRKTIVVKKLIEETVTIEEIEQPTTPIIKTISYNPQHFARALSSEEESVKSMAIDDLECRKELAKLLGMVDLPIRSPDAFAKLDGLFDDITESEDVDVVKWVRSLRRKY
jgi:hypothetical protein